MNTEIIETVPAQTEDLQSPNGKKRVWKTILLVLLLLAAGAFVLYLTNDVMREKWSYSEYAAQQVMQGYYEEKDHTLDVLCLGSSGIRNGVSGLQMYHDYGFTTYSRSSSNQLPVVSYYFLQETLAQQDIKAVVMDALSMTNSVIHGVSKESVVGKIHEAIDYMPWSSYKLKMIRDILKMDLPVSMTDFAFPLYAYHERWSELDEDDFTYREWQDWYYYKGQNPTVITTAYTFDADFMQKNGEADNQFWIEEDYAAYVDKMQELCKERGIEFILVKMPGTNWSNYKHNVIARYARERGIPFLDFNLPELQDEIAFNSKTDFYDAGKHLNITGAKKVSEYLGAFIAKTISYEDKRNDEAYASWNEDYEKYERLLKDAELRRETNLISFLGRLDDPDYITMIATRNSTSQHFNKDVAAAFAQLGINAPFTQYEYLSYLAVLDGGKLIYEERDENPLDDDSEVMQTLEVDGHQISIRSVATRVRNNATIMFDGEDVSPNLTGFNFVVYDRSVNQIVVTRAFNTGLKGVEYSPPNPFSSVSGDPVAYLDLLNNDDYITVIGVRGSGGQYIPGSVNQKLAEMGLQPLDGDVNRPYLAILNGSEIVYNEYGELNGELNWDGTVAGVPVTAVSSTGSKQNNFYSMIGGDRVKAAGDGFLVHVYSKKDGAPVAKRRFIWSNNFVTSINYSQISNLGELLSTAAKDEIDIICLYAPDLSPDGIDETYLSALKGYGFSDLESDRYYAGIRQASGECLQNAGLSPVNLHYETDAASADFSAAPEEVSADFQWTAYRSQSPGVYILLYNAEHDAVIAERRYIAQSTAASDSFTEVRSDPVSFLEHARGEDYITVIGVCKDASRFLPAAVDDKLSEMGLLPLDGEFDRPYLAILDGGEVVYNQYGEVGGVLSTAAELDGISVTAVSSSSASDAHFFSLINDAQMRMTDTGLLVQIYSKSELREVTRQRYNWLANFITGTEYTKISNIHEFLSIARADGVDVLCVYRPEAKLFMPDDQIEALRYFGFTDVENDGYFVGCAQADGVVTQKHDDTLAELTLDRNGIPIAFTSSAEGSAITVNGVTYPASASGLYILLYHSDSRSVIAAKTYAAKRAPVIGAFEKIKNDPVACLEKLRDPDYISVISVSVDGTEYIPGTVNEKLIEMGLLPLDGQYGQSYLAVLNGEEILFNQYGTVWSELSFKETVEDIPVYAVSNTATKGHKVYVQIGTENEYRNLKVGFTVYVYSKQYMQNVFVQRYNWNVNYVTSADYSAMTSIREIFSTAAQEGNEVLCLYSNRNWWNGISEEHLEELRAFGVAPDEVASNFVAVVHPDGQTEKTASTVYEPAEMTVKGIVSDVELSAALGSISAKLKHSSYQFRYDGLYILIYNPQTDTVLRAVTCGAAGIKGIR